MATPRLLFWPNTHNLSVASYRIRCRNVVDGLKAKGVHVGYYDGRVRRGLGLNWHISPPDILVLSRRTKYTYLEWAVAMKRRYGVRLVLDVCDNIFFGKAPETMTERDEKAFRAIRALNEFDAIVTPAAFLQRALAAFLRPDMRFVIIPDAVEPDPVLGPYRRFRERRAFADLDLLREKLLSQQIAPGRRLVWFGSHGTNSARNGMHDLAHFSEALEKHNREEKLSLTVISNNREKFDSLFSKAGFETLYSEWNYYTINPSMRLHDIALIPVRQNDYNLSKSANRLTTAFDNGLAVCASTIESYEPFRDIAVFDDWETGLSDLMRNPDDRTTRIAMARDKITQNYTQDAVSRDWITLAKTLM
jgi:hypothetical protein